MTKDCPICDNGRCCSRYLCPRCNPRLNEFQARMMLEHGISRRLAAEIEDPAITAKRVNALFGPMLTLTLPSRRGARAGVKHG